MKGGDKRGQTGTNVHFVTIVGNGDRQGQMGTNVPGTRRDRGGTNGDRWTTPFL